MRPTARWLSLVLLACLASSAPTLVSGAQDRRGGGRGSDDAATPAGSDARKASKRDAPEDFSKKYFDMCDYSKDGWISFTEAEASLRIDRETFAVYDVDRDGRIDFDEFRARYLAMLKNDGSFAPPVPKSAVRKAPRRSPDELLSVYDKNSDGALDLHELKPVLIDYAVEDISPEKTMVKLDSDSSGKLEPVELSALVSVLSPRIGPAHRAPRVTTIEALFGRVLKREPKPNSPPEPPAIPGPVSAFRRLDLDNDGVISTRDLLELERPLQLSVRVNSVLASLDTDGDGVVSKQEFWASMGASKP